MHGTARCPAEPPARALPCSFLFAVSVQQRELKEVGKSFSFSSLPGVPPYAWRSVHAFFLQRDLGIGFRSSHLGDCGQQFLCGSEGFTSWCSHLESPPLGRGGCLVTLVTHF